MTKLRLLKFHNANASQGPNFLPGELRWLDWHGYPSKCLPANFQGEKLVGLKMQYSRVIQLWKGLKVLDNLKFINLSHSQKLIRTPDFSGIPNLEKLILKDCTSLVEIDASVGFHRNLTLLDLSHCINLKRLPTSIHLEKLEALILSGCLKLENFPKIGGRMACLLEVYAEATALRELPSSIEYLQCLSLMNLSYCNHLASLPNNICRLKGLKTLILRGCSKFDKLPDDLGQMDSLEVLCCDATTIQELPSSISLLKNLKFLSFNDCKPLASRSKHSLFLPWLLQGTLQDTKISPFTSLSGLSSLKTLDMKDCSMLEGGVVPSDLAALPSLEVLNLSNNKFTSIPLKSIAGLTRLRELHLVGCQKLETLPELPSNIREVYADECTALKGNMDLFTKYLNLLCISFTKCGQLLGDPSYSHMVDALLQHQLKLLSVANRDYSICLPGITIPMWFTYKNLGPSISVSLPQNWYNNKFIGIALCVVTDLISTSHCSRSNIVSTEYGMNVKISITAHNGLKLSIGKSICWVGTEHQNVDSELTCLAYVPLDEICRWTCNSQLDNPNEWCGIEVSGYHKLVYTGFGMRLVYEDDVKQSNRSLRAVQYPFQSSKFEILEFYPMEFNVQLP